MTTHRVTGQQFFYRWPEPPYLDNASACVTVYATTPAPAQPAPEPSKPEQAEGLSDPWPSKDQIDLAHQDVDLFGRGFTVDGRRVSPERVVVIHPTTPPASAAGERTPQDFAIEHAEYMAQAAEYLITAVNDLAKAEQEAEEGVANDSDVDAARETLSEIVGNARGSIYEFRKRRDRAALASKPLPEQVAQDSELLTEEEQCALQYCEHVLYDIELGRARRSDESHFKDYRAATITDAKRMAAAARKRFNPVFVRLMRADRTRGEGSAS